MTYNIPDRHHTDRRLPNMQLDVVPDPKKKKKEAVSEYKLIFMVF